jgi:subtilisin-like proprotein convertase family protein
MVLHRVKSHGLTGRFTAWSAIGVLLVVLGLSGITGTDVMSQPADADASGHEHERKPFDLAAQFEFKHSLPAYERESLIALRSRYELADPDLPLPTGEPDQVFYIKFRKPLDRTFADALKDAGTSFVGYAALNTHFVRARDAESLHNIEALLRDNPNVAGTLLRAPEDACDEQTWAEYRDSRLHHGAYRILFWSDVKPQYAEMLLAGWGAEVLEASVDADGRMDLETPYVIAALERAAFEQAVTHPWVEIIEHAPELATLNVDSQALHRAREQDVGVAPYNLTGTGMVVGVWESGAPLVTHNGFQNAGTGSPFASISSHTSGSRVLNANELTGSTLHATHVIGTIVSDGTGMSSGRGYAPNAYVAGYSWNNVVSERRAARHTWRIVADNHSYSEINVGYGGYNSTASTNDREVRDLLLNTFKSAGNDGPDDNTIRSDATSKNTFMIGAVSNQGAVATFSSRGPSADGRVIPHFTANGVGLLSSDNLSNSAWSRMSGTSMASPSAAGGVTLLAELWQREMDNQMFATDVARGVVAATAQDRGNPGPDYQYGYGLPDIKRAADLIMENARTGKHIVRGQIRQNETLEYPLTVTSSSTPLKVVLSWLDVWASTSASVVLVNDLDIELVEPGGVVRHFPWKGLESQIGTQTYQFTRTGPNRRDNLLVVDVASPIVGQWTIRVNGTNIPASPQSGVPNDVVGFVLVSEHEIDSNKVFIGDALNTTGPVAIPSNNQTGISRTFNISASGTIRQVRLYCDIRHSARGDLDIYLIHPDNTTAHLLQGGLSNQPDIIAIMPDTRQSNHDVNAFVGKSPAGVWTVRITDTRNRGSGSIEYLALEIDVSQPVNRPPVADAGPDQQVYESTQVQLDGSGSYDPDSDPLTYLWAQTQGPTVTLSSTTAVNPTFTAPTVTSPTDLRFTLTVDDGRGGVDSDSVTITVLETPAPNQPPVADAGPDQQVYESTQVQLDGSGSYDPDSDPLTYLWAQTQGPTVTLSSTTAVNPTFTAPTVTGPTDLRFTLTVDDGRGGVDLDSVTITVLETPPPPNQPPVADAGPDQQVYESTQVQLDGSGSYDPDSDPLTYLWTQTQGPTVTLSSMTAVNPTFTAPTVTSPTDLRFTLTVDDGRGGVDSDSVTITVLETPPGPNQPPVANAGPDQQVYESTQVQLDGSGSHDPDSDPLTYLWTQTQGPTVTLSSTTAVNPTFTAPTVTSPTDLRFTLTVDDGRGGVDSDSVTITVLETPPGPNQPPVADAGPNIVVESGTTGVLDGSGSYDPDGDPLTYAWVALTNIGLINLSDPTAPAPTFTAPVVSSDTTVTFQLTVDDGNGAQSSDTMFVTIVPDAGGVFPVADAGDDQIVAWNSSVQLDGTNSYHPAGGTITYLWQQIDGGTSIALSDAESATPSFVAPAVNDVLVFRLYVTDQNSNVNASTVKITVNQNGTRDDRGSDKDDSGCAAGLGGRAPLWLPVAALVLIGAARRRRVRLTVPA